MNEVEIWGVLNKKEFDSKLDEFTKKYGNPKIQERLAIQILGVDDPSLWTRIRITDGKAEIMQKVGSWDIGEQKEISVSLSPDLETVWRTFVIIKNLLKKRRYQVVIIQHKNFTFKTDGYEIKLSHQFGKTSKYPFEVEATKKDSELVSFAKKLGLTPDLKKKGEEFWNKWNEEVNLDGEKMKDKELKEIIRKYIKGN